MAELLLWKVASGGEGGRAELSRTFVPVVVCPHELQKQRGTQGDVSPGLFGPHHAAAPHGLACLPSPPSAAPGPGGLAAHPWEGAVNQQLQAASAGFEIKLP